MNRRCDAPQFDQRDWSQFNLSRWQGDGLSVDDTSSAFAHLMERLFNSQEWREHVQDTPAGLQRHVLAIYQEQARRLEEERSAAERDFDQRIAAAEERGDGFRKALDDASRPPVVQPEASSFRAAVRVTARDAALGLPGIVVRILDPRKAGALLAHAVTDGDGNSILTVSGEGAPEMDTLHTTLEVLNPAGKSLKKLRGAVCVRLDQTETKVVTLPDSPDIRPHKDAALATRSELELRARSLPGKVDRLRHERDARLRNIDRSLEDHRRMIAALEPSSAPGPRPSSPRPEPDEPRPATEVRPRVPRKGRKK